MGQNDRYPRGYKIPRRERTPPPPSHPQKTNNYPPQRTPPRRVVIEREQSSDVAPLIPLLNPSEMGMKPQLILES